jgi:mono/diheme cytochrome c family protein
MQPIVHLRLSRHRRSDLFLFLGVPTAALVTVILFALWSKTAAHVAAAQEQAGGLPRFAAASPKQPSKENGRTADPAACYRKNCHRCHGADGKGTEAREGGVPTPDFTRRSWQEKRTDDQLLVSILDGKGTDMPAFQDKLSNQEAKALVSHVRKFGPQAKKAAQAVPQDFEIRFRALENEFKELQRQFRKAPPVPRQP